MKLFFYYTKLLRQIHVALQKKQVLFHYENAPAHTSAVATIHLVELLPHPP